MRAGDPLISDLRSALAPDRVRDGSTEVALYKRDASTISGRAGVVCFPLDTEEVRQCVLIARRHGRCFVPRGSGTGLAGGAVPLDGAVVIATTKMDKVLSVHADERYAWVQPGVLNLDLTRAVAAYGLHFAPDPSSQQSCSVGGNVANNSGGPHCLAYGVTSQHVLAIEVVLPDGDVVVLGGVEPEPDGLDLRGAFVGSEGMLGIATRIAVRLTEDPPVVKTMLLDFSSVDEGAATVSAIIAAGILPAAIEMMDALITKAVEEFVHAGFPTDAAAVLIVEVDGLAAAVADDVEKVRAIGVAHGARTVRVAKDAAERATIWKGRKSAFGAIARIKPDYYLHDTVVPRSKLVEVLREVYAIAQRHELIVMNVFHAGDGNLHPLLVFDRREPGVDERVHAAGEEIVRVSVASGGVLSGEHGIGLEKRDLMPLMFSAADLDHQNRLRCAFDPDGWANPHKVLPEGSRCADLQAVPPGAWV
ncbi:MAG TPA: FAD-linked oxidase C-terminal domain-containing protein [Acidimicrobiales bacterium]